MGSIAKRPDGTWRARWREFPGGPQKARHFRRKADAELFLRDIQVQLATGVYVDPRAGAETFETYAKRWFAAQVGAPQTLTKVESLLNKHLIPEFGAKPLRSVRTTEVQAFVKRLGATHKPASVEVTYNYLAAIFRGAVADRLIIHSPCVGIRRPVKVQKHVEVLSMEQVAALAAAMPDDLRAMVWLAVGSGMRISEILGLQLSRVDFLRRSITVDQQLVTSKGAGTVLTPPKSRASNRVIPVAAATTEALAAHLAGRPAMDGPLGQLVFRSDDGGPVRMSQAQHHVRVAREKSGVAPSFHALRHSYASFLITAGESVKVVQERLGHATPAQTMNTYVHLWPADEQRTRDIMERTLRQSSPAALRTASEDG